MGDSTEFYPPCETIIPDASETKSESKTTAWGENQELQQRTEQEQDKLIQIAENPGLWLKQQQKQLRFKAAKSDSIQMFSPRTIINDMDALPSPRVKLIQAGKGVVPPIRHESTSLEKENIKEMTRALFKNLLSSILCKNNKDMFLTSLSTDLQKMAENPEDTVQLADYNLYILINIMPVLLPGLVELTRILQHTAVSRRLGSGRRPVIPTEWLGIYLMRHNSKHLTQEEVAENMRANNDLNIHLIISGVVADLLAAQKAERRNQIWQQRSKQAMKNLWNKVCPVGSEEIHLNDIQDAIREFSVLLNLGDNLEDAQHMFNLMDVDGSGGISYEEFETVLSKHLTSAEHFAKKLAGISRTRGDKVENWIHRVASTKIEERLTKNGIDAQQLFKKYAREGLISVPSIQESMDEISGMIDNGSMCIKRLKISNTTALNYKNYKRLVGQVINEAAQAAGEAARISALQLAAARANEEAAQHHDMLIKLHRVEENYNQCYNKLKASNKAIKESRNKLAAIEDEYSMMNHFQENCVMQQIQGIYQTAVTEIHGMVDAAQVKLVSANSSKGSIMKRIKDTKAVLASFSTVDEQSFYATADAVNELIDQSEDVEKDISITNIRLKLLEIKLYKLSNVMNLLNEVNNHYETNLNLLEIAKEENAFLKEGNKTNLNQAITNFNVIHEHKQAFEQKIQLLVASNSINENFNLKSLVTDAGKVSELLSNNVARTIKLSTSVQSERPDFKQRRRTSILNHQKLHSAIKRREQQLQQAMDVYKNKKLGPGSDLNGSPSRSPSSAKLHRGRSYISHKLPSSSNLHRMHSKDSRR